MRRSAFTLIELLLVVAILAILAAIVVVAMRPTGSAALTEQRNAQRRSDAVTILRAIYQYTVDNDHLPGYLSGALVGTSYQICVCNSVNCAPRSVCGLPENNMINLRALTGTYLVSIPRDPLLPATASGSRYLITRDRKNHLTVTAPDAENGAEISVTQ